MAGQSDEVKIAQWKEEISDIEKCLANDPTSRRFRIMQGELTKLKGSIYAAEQRSINQSIPGVVRSERRGPFWWEIPSYT